jgi:integrating conjugative element protein (TIGR03746 family)
MSGLTAALANRDATIRRQAWFIAALMVLLLIALVSWRTTATDVTAHVPPDLSRGTALRLGRVTEVPHPNVYGFGFYIWQQVNRWAKDGSKDYGAQIFALQHYLTPSCREQLLQDLRIKAGDAELIQRTRALMEIPGYGYSANRVSNHGNGGWTVLIDAQLIETSRGMPVKDAFVRYPLHVVRYDVDREKNPWGLALNCFGVRHPERIDPQALEVPAGPLPQPAASLPPTVKAPDLPPAPQAPALPPQPAAARAGESKE